MLSCSAVKKGTFAALAITSMFCHNTLSETYAQTITDNLSRSGFVEETSDKISVKIIKKIHKVAIVKTRKDQSNVNDTVAILIEDQIKLLKEAGYRFDVESSMDIDDFQTPILKVSLTKSGTELLAESQDKGEIVVGDIKIAKFAEAELTGPDFDITKLSPEQQVVTPHKDVLWRWEIRPKKEGNLKLYLTLYSLLTVGDKEKFHNITSLHKMVNVNVNLKQSLAVAAKDLEKHPVLVDLMKWFVVGIGSLLLWAYRAYVHNVWNLLKNKFRSVLR